MIPGAFEATAGRRTRRTAAAIAARWLRSQVAPSGTSAEASTGLPRP
jgi:hypothetical protein